MCWFIRTVERDKVCVSCTCNVFSFTSKYSTKASHAFVGWAQNFEKGGQKLRPMMILLALQAIGKELHEHIEESQK